VGGVLGCRKNLQAAYAGPSFIAVSMEEYGHRFVCGRFPVDKPEYSLVKWYKYPFVNEQLSGSGGLSRDSLQVGLLVFLDAAARRNEVQSFKTRGRGEGNIRGGRFEFWGRKI